MSEMLAEPQPVNAGGRTMRGFLPGLRMEADPGEGAAAGAAATGAADPGEAAAAVAPVEAAAPAAAAIDFNDPAVIDALDQLASARVEQQLAPLVPIFEQLGALGGEQQGPQIGALDPYDENFGGQLAQLLQHAQQQTLSAIDQRLQQIQAPLAAREEAETISQGEQRLKDMLADDIARNGDFPRAEGQTSSQAESLVVPLARALFPEIAGRFGQTPRAAEIAMGQAAQTVRAIVAEAQAAARTAQTNHLSTLAGATGEPGAAGAVAVEGLSDKPLSSRELAMKYGAKAHALTRT